MIFNGLDVVISQKTELFFSNIIVFPVFICNYSTYREKKTTDPIRNKFSTEIPYYPTPLLGIPAAVGKRQSFPLYRPWRPLGL
jgi:hypothetical protein